MHFLVRTERGDRKSWYFCFSFLLLSFVSSRLLGTYMFISKVLCVYLWTIRNCVLLICRWIFISFSFADWFGVFIYLYNIGVVFFTRQKGHHFCVISDFLVSSNRNVTKIFSAWTILPEVQKQHFRLPECGDKFHRSVGWNAQNDLGMSENRFRPRTSR